MKKGIRLLAVPQYRPRLEGRLIAESTTSPPQLLRDAAYLAGAHQRAQQAIASLDQSLQGIDSAVANDVPTVAAI